MRKVLELEVIRKQGDGNEAGITVVDEHAHHRGGRDNGYPWSRETMDHSFREEIRDAGTQTQKE